HRAGIIPRVVENALDLRQFRELRMTPKSMSSTKIGDGNDRGWEPVFGKGNAKKYCGVSRAGRTVSATGCAGAAPPWSRARPWAARRNTRDSGSRPRSADSNCA